jgi:VanZ family protein
MADRRTLTLVATALLSIAVLVVGTRPSVPAAFRRAPDWSTHGATYAALAFLSQRSALHLALRPAAAWAGAYAAGHGGLLEVLQSAVPARAAQWRDVFADAVGAALGLAAAALRRPR